MNFAEQLKAQVDIVRTVGDYVQLRKAGARFVGLCPFHNEKTPSFNVNPGLGIYKCFGCGAGGDVIKFVQEIESISFWDALKTLAERNGIPLPQRREDHDPQTELRSVLLEIHKEASRAFSEALRSEEGMEAREYLGRRGLTQSAVEEFGLGYSSRSGQELVRRLGRKFGLDVLRASGLFAERNDGSLFDRFRGRLMFPIHSEAGSVIAFGGRALRGEDEPKYLNSPETLIYKKSGVLYNLHRSKDAIRKADRVILVEGYMDVIGVYIAGVRNVVASCGTALASQQVRSIKRHSVNIVVNFDPDTAGANATERSIQMLLEERMHVRVLDLEAGLDPDEYIRKYGAGKYADRLERSSGYFIWLADRARRKFDMNTAEGRMQGFETLLLPAIRRISDRLERATVAGEVAAYLGVERSLVLNEFRRAYSERRSERNSQQEANPVPLRERVVLRTLLTDVSARDTLVPALRSSATVRFWTTWPVLDSIFEILDAESELHYQVLEERSGDQVKRLLFATFFADKSDEIMSAQQAQAFGEMLRKEDGMMELQTLRHEIEAAEKAGDVQAALNLMLQLEERTRRQDR